MRTLPLTLRLRPIKDFTINDVSYKQKVKQGALIARSVYKIHNTQPADRESTLRLVYIVQAASYPANRQLHGLSL